MHHEEQGHYETVSVETQKVKCHCGKLFDSDEEWYAHQQAYVAQMRKEKNDPNYTCDGTHEFVRYITVMEPREEYVVDQEAYTERVLVSEGHWE